MINELIKQRKETKVHQFLIGLDDAIFGTVLSNILQMEPIPNIKIYAMIIEEKAHRKMIRIVEIGNEVIVFAAPKANLVHCTYCFKLGHEAKNSYLLVGFSERSSEHLTERWTYRSLDTSAGGRRGRGKLNRG